MCNSCENEICECGKTIVLLNPIGGSASMTNVGAQKPLYKTGTSVPFEMRTLGIEPPTNNIAKYGFQIDQTTNEVILSYNPLRGNTLFVDATYGDDATAIVNHQDMAFLTLTEAVAAASAGDLIIVNPGFYDCSIATGNTLIWKDGVNIYCHPKVELNVGNVNWNFSMTITQNTGIYGYAELYIDALSTSPTTNIAGFLAGFDVPPSHSGNDIPTTTLEINNLYFTNGTDIQNLILQYKANLFVRNSVYGNKAGAGAAWIFINGSPLQINVKFETCYNCPAFEVSAQLNVDPIDLHVNVTWGQILTQGYDPTYNVVRVRNNPSNAIPAAAADPDKNNPINVILKGDIIHENTAIPSFPETFAAVFSLTDNMWSQYSGKVEQKYDTCLIRNDGNSINASHNCVFKMKDATIIMPDDDSLYKSMIYTARGIGDEVQELYIMDNVTLIMSRNTAALATSTIYRWQNTAGGSWVIFNCYGLKTNVDCTSAATMFDNVAANTVTLNTPLGFIQYDAYINN